MHIKYALRQFWKSPGFTSAAVLTLALGIGGTTAIFTLIDAVMLRSLPVTDPAALYRIGEGDNCCVQGGPQGQWGMFPFSLVGRFMAQAPASGFLQVSLSKVLRPESPAAPPTSPAEALPIKANDLAGLIRPNFRMADDLPARSHLS
jgi:hypothetical protein